MSGVYSAAELLALSKDVRWNQDLVERFTGYLRHDPVRVFAESVRQDEAFGWELNSAAAVSWFRQFPGAGGWGYARPFFEGIYMAAALTVSGPVGSRAREWTERQIVGSGGLVQWFQYMALTAQLGVAYTVDSQLRAVLLGMLDDNTPLD